MAARYRDDPDRARVTVRVATELTDGMRCSTTARSHVVHADEPRSLGGTDTAQSPVELMLTSLATCQAVTYRLWASELGIAVGRIAVDVEGDIDLRGFLGVADAPAGYGAIRIRVAVEGPEAPERYRELAAAADEHCPVLDVLRRPVQVTRELATPA
ncbi:OsmC family protein [Miltoncostaea marina]|uniref:OsmC family protein n=1 Tax=Miltoncostaea marina TaxID=2843215 RepID=UPI001C3C6E2F|nr:OsmC family protein [Miltoncostaea marina]